MEHYCYSRLHDCFYLFDGCIKIINLKQALFYISEGVEIKDIYPSLNYQTGRRVLVFIVDKFDSMNAYNRWRALQNAQFECRKIKEINDPDWVRVLNVNQVIFYLDHKVRIKECAPVIDYKTKEPVLAFYFDKEESAKVYQQWLETI